MLTLAAHLSAPGPEALARHRPFDGARLAGLPLDALQRSGDAGFWGRGAPVSLTRDRVTSLSDRIFGCRQTPQHLALANDRGAHARAALSVNAALF
ncbi:hypothetical protein [Sediminicurvatus halobius]|uniref:hypothetical protein n=1 Tax=Sediminicurvatus halobius TaxID=2182432 RepID=UPI0011B28E6D|nr:hypothetical protein [Spiribacter halobius]UEX77284.1 hypothetical protein LMH63_15240 [Spiribacter halobius]